MGNRFKFRAWNGNYMDGGDYNSFLIKFNGEVGELETSSGDYDCTYFEENKDTILMQYTGLLDKNGKEIYEGDIVKYKTNYYGNYKEHITEIKWIDDLEHDGFGEPLAMGYIFRGYDIEIIGNIYENPELLNKK